MTTAIRFTACAVLIAFVGLASNQTDAQDFSKGRAKLAEMIAFVQLASEPCKGAVPELYAMEALMLRMTAKPPLADDEVESKEKEVRGHHERLGLAKWCELYAAEMTQAHLIVKSIVGK